MAPVGALDVLGGLIGFLSAANQNRRQQQQQSLQTLSLLGQQPGQQIQPAENVQQPNFLARLLGFGPTSATGQPVATSGGTQLTVGPRPAVDINAILAGLTNRGGGPRAPAGADVGFRGARDVTPQSPSDAVAPAVSSAPTPGPNRVAAGESQAPPVEQRPRVPQPTRRGVLPLTPEEEEELRLLLAPFQNQRTAQAQQAALAARQTFLREIGTRRKTDLREVRRTRVDFFQKTQNPLFLGARSMEDIERIAAIAPGSVEIPSYGFSDQIDAAIYGEFGDVLGKGESPTPAQVRTVRKLMRQEKNTADITTRKAIAQNAETIKRANLRLTPSQQSKGAALNDIATVASTIAREFTPDIVRDLVGARKRVGRTIDAIKGNPAVARFLTLVGRMKSALLFSRTEGGGGALTPNEQAALEAAIPTGNELTAESFLQKLQILVELSNGKVAQFINIAGLPDAEAERVRAVFAETRATSIASPDIISQEDIEETLRNSPGRTRSEVIQAFQAQGALFMPEVR